MGQIPRAPLPQTIRVQRWADPLVEESGYPLNAAYVETFWLPVLGPTALWTARRLAGMVAAHSTIEVDVERLALAVGVGPDLGPNDTMPLTIRRLVGFGVMQGHREFYEVRTHLAELPLRRVERLPEFLRDEHARRTAATT